MIFDGHLGGVVHVAVGVSMPNESWSARPTPPTSSTFSTHRQAARASMACVRAAFLTRIGSERSCVKRLPRSVRCSRLDWF